MQNAKDSFYMALRTRLATINPQRTTLVRGAARPGILVEDAEAPQAQSPDGVFVLRWGALAVNQELDTTLTAMECEIVYQSCGAQSYGGLDRGRALTEMDKEAVAMLQPLTAPKANYTGAAVTTMLTQIFWDAPAFGPIIVQRDRLSRSVKVKVYSYEEQGE
jgi:hypothetical protein